MQQTISWPPTYQLTISARAKYLNLKINKKGLQVTAPVGMKEKDINAFIKQKKNWIIKHLSQVASKQQPFVFPKQLILHAIDKTIKIFYEFNSEKTASMIMRPDNQFVYFGIRDQNIFTICVKELLKQIAKAELIPWLYQLSKACHLSIASATIRDATTRWGSCSSRKSISLNSKLLFLPKVFVRYTMIHELCHTKQMNHSEKFWRLVEKYDANFKQHKKIAQLANQYLPDWIE